MRTTGCALAVTLILAAVGIFRAGDAKAGDAEAKEAQALLKKAMEAHGGEAKLAKVKALYMRGNGKITAGEDFPFSAEYHAMGTTHSKLAIELTAMGQVFKVVKVVAGDKGWQKIGNDASTDLNDDEMAADKALLYLNHAALLAPLKDKAYKLSPLGESKVGDKAAVGLRVSREGKADISLYFDKKTHMLLKSETNVKDQGQEVLIEIFLGDYKAVDGVQIAHRWTVHREGKAYVEATFTDVVPYGQKLDDSVFAKP
jgi:hypothetical protein